GNFGQIKLCTDYSASFTGGNLKCTSACQLNTSGCTEKPKCGNNVIDAGESCDLSNLGPLTGKCNDYSMDFNDGNLKCTSCKLDTNECKKSPTCGNGKLDTGETCDGSNFGNITDLSCTNYKNTFNSGTLTCKNCRVSTDKCNSNATTAPPITCRDRGTCRINELCTDNSDCESRYCSLGKCSEPTCNDNFKNQEESDVDCGGACSSKCGNGKSCRFNSDCSNGYCSLGKCSSAETCSDGKLSPSEADVDCGGPCPLRCSEGNSCILDEDCDDGLQCASDKCTKISTAEPVSDSDGDGMPDDWELQNGLDPSNPGDAGEDLDNDGLTNKEEYETQNTYSIGTDPNNADTDNDGYSDKEEIENDTDPTNPEDFPKSNLTKIILFIVGAVVLLGGFGYLAYVAVEKKKESEFAAWRQTPKRTMTPQQKPVPRQPIFMQKQQQRAEVNPNAKAIEDIKNIERKKLFESFGGKQAEKPLKPENAKAEKEIKTEEKPKEGKQRSRRKPQQKKPKEDVFLRLKTIAQESKKKSGKKNAPK
ncbi:hypothetical protein HY637_03185, partial [Candidatus Woesearchaeota archaeon]|nr:hypothetical protein [Candidatus Woesearchaeota archaeon]